MSLVKSSTSLLLIVLLSGLLTFAVSQNIVINEFMSSNSATIADEDGDFEDWIELYNAGQNAVSLSGYGLSDNTNNPFKWVFPDTVMQPGQHLLVWASGKDRKPVGESYYQGLLREVYMGIPGTAVANLTSHPSYPDNPTTTNMVTALFEAPSDIADNYGQRMHGWIKAPATGNYYFWIASDDNSELHLSTDASPGNLQLIASVPGWTSPRQWEKYASQQSSAVHLTQGQYYYVMALMKEGSGGDNLAVGWHIPGMGLNRPIDGQYLFRKQAELHTNFSIKASGEDLLLTLPNGTTIDEVEAVALPTDVSYGRKPDGENSWYFFDEPTPGEANTTAAYTNIQAPPVFSHAEGTYTANFQLSLQSDPDATIYYTTNGEMPVPGNAIVYTSPISVWGTMMVRAKAYREGYLPSQPVTKLYTRISADLQNFSSNLPLVILHEFNTPITPGDRTKAAAVFIDNNNGDNTMLTGDIALHSDILANIRGSSSQYFYPKKMFGFHLVDDYELNRDEALFGMPAEHNWILNGPYGDKTLMRNAIAYQLGNGFGKWAPRTRFVELFLHSGTGPVNSAHYHGVYVLIERIKWGDDRLNITEIGPGDNSEPEITGGYIIKKDRINDGEQGFITDRGTNLAFVRPNEQNASPQQKTWIRDYVSSFEDALYGEAFANPQTGYAAYIDVDSFIDHFLLTELLKEIDGYRLSTFMYKDRNQKLVMGPAWDFNLSLGNGNYFQAWMPQGWYYPLINPNDCFFGCGVRDWYVRLLEDPAYMQKMNFRWWQLRQDLFSNQNLSGMIQNFSQELAEAQVRNFERWPVLGQYVWPNWFIGQTYEEEVNWMHNWLMSRLNWMDGQMGDPPVFPDYTLLYFWVFDSGLPNNTPLENIPTSFQHIDSEGLNFHSALAGYPFYEGHPNWRKASMERRNAPTPINYRPEGNNGTPYNNANMRGMQVKQPFTGDAGENTLYFHLPSTNFENLLFSFAAMDEGAATHLVLDYSVNPETDDWINTGLSSTTWPLASFYQLFEIDFSGIASASNNPHFKIRMRFEGDDMTADNGDRVTFNNISLEGEQISGTNLPPYVANPLSLQSMVENDSALQLDLNDIFNDPDNDPLEFTAVSDNESMVSATLNGSMLTLNPLRRGQAHISLLATDGNHPAVHHSFRILVYPAAKVLKDDWFSFNHWSADEPEYSYPENMLFLQSDISDPGLGADLLYAYYIPHDDYHANDQGTIGFPYNNTGRTRINGLGDEGISFVNTGRNRDLGGALLAIDTRNVTDAELSWLAGTLLQNQRQYGIRLQYRTSVNAPFTNYLVDGLPVEYIASNDGDNSMFSSIPIPEILLENPYVQLLWRYYHIAGDSGPRAQLRLDDIQISGTIGIGETQEGLVRAYANNRQIIVELPQELSGHISLYDITGRFLGQKRFAGKTAYRLETAGSPSGLFVVQIVTDGQVFVRKVLVQ